MKKIATILAVILLVNGFSACEKDDICSEDTPTTPRLMIEFYGDNNVLKPVTNLKVTADGVADPIVFNADVTTASRYLTNASNIALPLDLSAEKVTYEFTLNATDTTGLLLKTDKIEFNYRRKTIYVSRACGYKMLFDLNNLPDLPEAYVLNNTTPPQAGNWIKRIFIEKFNLESENETHVKIYF